MKNILIIFSLVTLLGADCSAAFAHGLTVTPYIILDIKEPTLAPGDYFYFLKNIGWSLRQTFTFDAIKKNRT